MVNISTWLKSRQKSPKRKPTRRLTLERLEERLTPSATLTLNENYAAINFGQSGGYTPPDTDGAAGTVGYVEAVNQAFELFPNKTTSAGGIIDSASDFWFNKGGLTKPAGDKAGGLSDTMVVWDDQINRFIIGDQYVDFTSTAKGGNHVSSFYLAVSKTAAPTTLTNTDWNFYSINTTENTSTPGYTNNFDADYPGNFGYNHDAFVFTLNMFGPQSATDGGPPDESPSGTISNSFHTLVVSVNSQDLLNGVSQGNLRSFNNDVDGGSLRPTVMHDAKAGDPMWFVTEHGDGASLDVIKMTSVLSNSPAFTTTQLAVNPYTGVGATGFPVNPDGTAISQHVDSRILKAAEANNTIVATHQVTNAAGDRSLARWYSINVTGGAPTLNDQGDVANAATGAGSANVYDIMPGIDINASGDIGMTFIESSHTGANQGEFMSMYVTGRRAADAAGTMQKPILVPAGAGVQDYSDFAGAQSRVGDMSGINVAADGTFWAINEFADSEKSAANGGGADWGTAVAHFTLVPPFADLTVSQVIAPNPKEGQDATYTIRIHNNGPAAATNVILTDLVPAGTIFDSAKSTAGYNVATGQYNLGTIKVNATVFVTFAVLTGEEGTTITNTVSVASDQIDITPSDDTNTLGPTTVVDSLLTAGALTPPIPVEGAANTNVVLFHFSDADPNGAIADYTANVAWGDGKSNTSADGSNTVQVIANLAGGFDVVGSHTYLEELANGNFSVSVSDVGGAPAISGSMNTLTVTDAALTAGKLTPPAVTANVPLNNAVLFHFTDADPNGAASDYIATVTWGDGKVENSGGNPNAVSVVASAGGGFDVRGTHTYPAPLTGATFTVSVVDHGAAPVSASKTPFSVGSSTLTAGTLTTPVVAEGAPVTNFVLFHFTDSDGTATIANYTAGVAWGDGTTETSSANPAAVSIVASGSGYDVVGSHTYLDELSNANFNVFIIDHGLISASGVNKSFNVTDAALTSGTPTSPVITENAVLTNFVVFHFTDANPNATASDFSASVAWGDGTMETSNANPTHVSIVAHAGGGFDVLGSHTYGEEQAGTGFTVFVLDAGGAATGVNNPAFSVQDAPLIGTLNSPVVTENFVAANLVLFHFTDADPNAAASIYTATVAWGDGTTDTSSANPTHVSIVANGNGFDVVGSHTYGEDQSGTPFSITLSDVGGAALAVSDAAFKVRDSALTAGTLTVPASTEGFPSTPGLLFHFTDTDVNGAAFDYIATVNWGDGTSNSSNDGSGLVVVQPNISGGFDVFGGAHVLQSEETNGLFSVVVADKGGAAVTSSVAFSAGDAPLTAIGITTPFNPNVGTRFSGFPLFHFSDVDPNATGADFVATVLWGDGSVENNIANPADVQVASDGAGGFYVIGGHSYPFASPSLPLQVYVSDVGGAAAIRGAVLFSVGGDVIINGTAGDDTVVVNAIDATSGTYTINGGPAVAFSGANSLTFSGNGGNDHLIIHNFAGGEFAPPGGFSYDGGPAGTGTLNVDAAGSFFRTRPGVIEVGDPLVISYANVASIQLDNGVAVNALAGQDTVDRDTAFIGLNPQERFVQALYLDELGRAGARSELQPWVGLLSVRGTAAVASAIDHSVEARVHLVNSWYLEYLGRAPGAGETAGWAGLLLQGKSEEFVLGNILATPEFYAKAQTLSNAATADQRYVQALYLLLFNHPGDAGSVAGWVSTLPKQGRQGVAAAFLASPEFHLSNFEGYYNALLHRPASFASIQNLVFSTLDMETVRLAFEATPDFFFNG